MTTDTILSLLRSSPSGFLSGEVLARNCGISRAAVWKQIKALERDGYRIEAVPSKGYRLLAGPDRIRTGGLKTGAGRRIGREVRYFAELGSTNTVAMEAAQQGAPEGTVVLAERQTGGKGRLGRTWVSLPGNIFLSIILRPAMPTHKAPLITLAGAVAVAEAVRTICAVDAGIKWPNDVLINGKKVCGLLTELSAEPDRIRHVVLGIGVNANMDVRDLPADLRAVATSLAQETGKHIDRTQLVQAVLDRTDERYRQLLKNEKKVLDAWRGLSVTLGRRVTVSGSGETFSGTAVDIDDEGRLLVRQQGGAERQVVAGDVTILKR